MSALTPDPQRQTPTVPVGDPGRDRHRTGDRTDEAIATRRREIERGLAELVTPELVEEHRRQPVGRHSPALAAVLAYFRQAPTAGKLVVHARRPGAAGREPLPYELLRLSGRPGVAHEPLAGERFATEDDALHAAFVHRLAELREAGGAVGGVPGGAAGEAAGGAPGGTTTGAHDA